MARFWCPLGRCVLPVVILTGAAACNGLHGANGHSRPTASDSSARAMAGPLEGTLAIEFRGREADEPLSVRWPGHHERLVAFPTELHVPLAQPIQIFAQTRSGAEFRRTLVLTNAQPRASIVTQFEEQKPLGLFGFRASELQSPDLLPTIASRALHVERHFASWRVRPNTSAGYSSTETPTCSRVRRLAMLAASRLAKCPRHCSPRWPRNPPNVPLRRSYRKAQELAATIVATQASRAPCHRARC